MKCSRACASARVTSSRYFTECLCDLILRIPAHRLKAIPKIGASPMQAQLSRYFCSRPANMNDARVAQTLAHLFIDSTRRVSLAATAVGLKCNFCRTPFPAPCCLTRTVRSQIICYTTQASFPEGFGANSRSHVMLNPVEAVHLLAILPARRSSSGVCSSTSDQHIVTFSCCSCPILSASGLKL
jgi:hypothetical protein